MKNFERIQWLFLLFAVLGILAGCSQEPAVENLKSSKFQAKEQLLESLNGPYKVTKVTDGDTIHVMRNGADIRVRIIGINTPEIHPKVKCYGPEADGYAEKLLEGTSVYLEYDSTQAVLDRFGRPLAHVWTENKELYAAKAIKEGYGIEKTYAKSYHHRDLFLADQTYAQQHMKGLWSACPVR